MNKLEQIQYYIEQCESCTLDKAEQLVKEIRGTIGGDIPHFREVLQSGSYMNPDYWKDIHMIKAKLENYRINLLEQEQKDKYELQKLFYQAEISKSTVTYNNSNENHNSSSSSASSVVEVTVTIEQTLKRLEEMPSEILSSIEKNDLEDKLAAVDMAKNNNDKKKLSDKVFSVLKYLTDKSVEVGIAVLPYLGEISKVIERM